MMMKQQQYSGVIFDFNGTLFWDTPLHNKAWNTFFERHGLFFTDDEFFKLIHGKNNRDLLMELFNHTLTDSQIQEYIMEKETMYFNLCIEGNHLSLAPGAVDLFHYLKANQVPYTIATASGIENMDFYFKYLGIGEWFDFDKIIYNNGKVKSKPDGQIYELAMAMLNKKPEDVLVFEDAIAGLQAAKNAGSGKIVVVNSNDDDYREWNHCQIITHFDEIDRNIFKK